MQGQAVLGLSRETAASSSTAVVQGQPSVLRGARLRSPSTPSTRPSGGSWNSSLRTPASHLREICRALGLAMGDVQYHVRRLERDGRITLGATRPLQVLLSRQSLRGEAARRVERAEPRQAAGAPPQHHRAPRVHPGGACGRDPRLSTDGLVAPQEAGRPGHRRQAPGREGRHLQRRRRRRDSDLHQDLPPYGVGEDGRAGWRTSSSPTRRRRGRSDARLRARCTPRSSRPSST